LDIQPPAVAIEVVSSIGFEIQRALGLRPLPWHGGLPRVDRSARWSRRQESNLYLPLRRRPFYPLNYGERLAAGGRGQAV
jgi:hypothetical protein